MSDGVNGLMTQIRQRYDIVGGVAVPTDRGGRCDAAQVRSAVENATVAVQRGRMSPEEGAQVLRAASEAMLQASGPDAATISGAVRELQAAVRTAEAERAHGRDRIEAASNRAASPAASPATSQTPRQAVRTALATFPVPAGATPQSVASDVTRALFANPAVRERTLAGLSKLSIHEFDAVLQRRFGGAAPTVRQAIFEAVRTEYRAAVAERATEQLTRAARELGRFDDRDAQQLALGAARGDTGCRELIRRLCGDDAERMLTLAEASPGYPTAANEFRREIVVRAHEAAGTIREALPRFSRAHVMLDRHAVALFDCDRARADVDRRLGIVPGSAVSELVREDMQRSRDDASADRTMQTVASFVSGVALTVATGGLTMVAAGAIGVGASGLRASGTLGVHHQRAVEANALAVAGSASGEIADARRADYEHSRDATAAGVITGTAVGALAHAGDLPSMVSALYEASADLHAERLAHEALSEAH
jgi:hypothetical protein